MTSAGLPARPRAGLLLCFLLGTLAFCSGTPAAAVEHPPMSDEEYGALLQKPVNEHTKQESLRLFRETRYRRIRGIQQFFEPALVGSTFEEVGVSRERLQSFLSMRFLNNFAFMLKDFTVTSDMETEIGILTCKIMTAGDSYPIAYHVRCEGGPFSDLDCWNDETLGYTNRQLIEGTLKTILEGFVQDFATFVLKAKGKL